MDSRQVERRLARLGAALVALAALLTFARVLGHGFLSWDDDQHIVENAWLRPPSLAGVARFWAEPFKGLYAPLSYTVWAGLVWLAEGGAGGPPGSALGATLFRVAQLGLHVVAALFVLAILRRAVRSEAAAVAGALLFALHPLQVESVAWAAELRGLLAAALALAALRAFLAWRDRGGRGRYAVATLAYALALLAKPSALVTPLLAWWLDRRVAGSSARRVSMALLPWLFLAALSALATHALQPASEDELQVAWAMRPLVALDALGFYAWKFLWPLGLAPDALRSPEWLMGGGWRQGLWAVPLAVGAVLLAAPGLRERAAGLGLSALALAPVLGLVSFDHQQISTVADRYAYLALLGPAFLLAQAVDARAIPRPVAAAWLVALGAVSSHQAGLWRDTETLFGHNLAR